MSQQVRYDLGPPSYPIKGYDGKIALIQDPYWGRTFYGVSNGRVFTDKGKAKACQALIDSGATRQQTEQQIPMECIPL
jgi:hypothetical protein